MGTRARKLSYPDRKISATLLHYAPPILLVLPADATAKRIEQAPSTAYCAWNAVVYADVVEDYCSHLDRIRGIAAGQPKIDAVMEQLIDRNRELVENDERLIRTWEVLKTEDGSNVRADARDPHTIPRTRD
jgi:hypothetical protein